MALVALHGAVQTDSSVDNSSEQTGNQTEVQQADDAFACNIIQDAAFPPRSPAPPFQQYESSLEKDVLDVIDFSPSGTPPRKNIRDCQSPDSVLLSPDEDGLEEPVNQPVNRWLCLVPTGTPPRSSSGDTKPAKGFFSEPVTAVASSDLTNADFQDAKQEELPRPTEAPSDAFPLLTRRVSFADEWGSPLKEVRVMEAPPVRRLVLLLLSPEDRKFEFLHLEYPLDDSTTVQVVLEQLPKLVANPIFRQLSFSCLAKTSKNEKLDNMKSMADCDLADNELLIGILPGYSMNQIGGFAVPLLLNGDIIKAVSRAKRSGKGLKTIRSGREWYRRGKSHKISKSSPKKAPFPMEPAAEDTPQVFSLCDVDVEAHDPPSELAEKKQLDPIETVATNLSFEIGNTGADSENALANAETLDVLSESNKMSFEIGNTGDGSDNALANAEKLDVLVESNKLHATFEKTSCPAYDRQTNHCLDIDSNKKLSLDATARSVVEQLVANVEEHSGSCEAIPALLAESFNFDPGYEDACKYDSDDDECDHVSEAEEVPDLDQPGDSWKYPDIVRDYLHGDDGTEKAVFWIHAMSIAAVGYLSAVAMG